MANHLRVAAASVVALALSTAAAPTAQAGNSPSFLDQLAATASLSISTSPSSGPGTNDQNPYGVAVVPADFPSGGPLTPGDILVSNFNNAANDQGTGTTIVAVSPSGQSSTFFAAPASLGPVGLTTALLALRSGLVVVGSTPTIDGTSTVEQGGLLFIDPHGNVVLNLVNSTLLAGPWDMTADQSHPDNPILYVSNVLNGTVTRINLHVDESSGTPVPSVTSLTQIGSGFAFRPDPNALVVGPTGLVLEGTQTLYVADTGNNRIQVLQGVRSTSGDLGAGATVVSGAPLQGPLGLAKTPDGTLITSNGDAVNPTSTLNLVVEINPQTDSFVATRQLDTGAAGAIFGVFVAKVAGKSSLIYADDNTSTVNVIPRS